jgi:peptidoglycan/LPS O-acetylase OafA/YrhL
LQFQNSSHAYRPDIDGLRAVAVVAVVAFHFSPLKMPGGFVGVDVFFVISGYLISGIILHGLERDRFSFAEFYARRIRRIFPALAVVLTACLAIGWFALLGSEYELLGKHVAAGAGFISNFLLLGETGYFDIEAERKPLLHLWSLGIEEQFYIVWPLLLFLAWRRRCVVPAIGGILAASFVLNIALVDMHPSASFYLPFSRFWELALGSLLAEIDRRRRASPGSVLRPMLFRRRLEELIALLGAVLVATALVGLDRHSKFPGWWALLPAGGTFLLIAAGPAAWINRALLAQPAIVFVGLISYPLYLWHWPLLSFARIVEPFEPSREIKLTIIVVSVVLAWLTYQFVEKPIRFGARNQQSRFAIRRPVTLCIAMVCVGFVAHTVYGLAGFPDRVRDELASQHQAELVRTPRTDVNCDRYVHAEKRLFEYCRLDRPDAPYIVAIIGDSHAHALFAGLSERVSERGAGALLLASSGCPPFIGTAVGLGARDRDLCYRKTTQIIDFLLSRSEIREVIIVTVGTHWITGKGFGLDSGTLGIISPAGPDAADTEPGLATFHAGLKRTVEVLLKDRKAVSYLLQIPEMGVPVATCIRRPVQLTRRNSCEVDLQLMNQRHAAYRESVRALAQEIPGFKVVDPFPILCEGGRCKAFREGHLLYADGTHLSVSGSRYVSQRLF